MNKYKIDGVDIDSVDLKCLLVSRGVKIEKSVYKIFSSKNRLNRSPLTCNCVILSDGTIAQLTDMSFHLRYLTGVLSWDNLKLLRYASQLETPFSLKIIDEKPALLYGDKFLDFVSFPAHSRFYKQKTSSGLSFAGNAVLQGLDWAAFQCLWRCDYAADGQPCQFCFSGGDFENAAKKGKALPRAVPAADAAEIISYALKNENVSHVQITGGSTYDGRAESEYIINYLNAVGALRPDVPGEVLLYITPPADTALIDLYFELGTSRVACSLEVWDIDRARSITPGKINITGREKYLRILEYTAEKYGRGKAFSNFIIGIEDFKTLSDGAERLAERGIMPAASVWIPMGRPVMGSMNAPGVDYYRRVKELFAELYVKHKLEPTESRGLNVCIERDIWNYAVNPRFLPML